jgi:hypothetical protein
MLDPFPPPAPASPGRPYLPYPIEKKLPNSTEFGYSPTLTTTFNHPKPVPCARLSLAAFIDFGQSLSPSGSLVSNVHCIGIILLMRSPALFC